MFVICNSYNVMPFNTCNTMHIVSAHTLDQLGEGQAELQHPGALTPNHRVGKQNVPILTLKFVVKNHFGTTK